MNYGRCEKCLREVKNPDEKIRLQDERGKFTKNERWLWWIKGKKPGSHNKTEVFCWHCMLAEDKKIRRKGNKRRLFFPLIYSLERDRVVDEENMKRAEDYQKEIRKEDHRICHVCGSKHGQIICEEGHKPFVTLVGAVTSDRAETLQSLIKEISQNKEIRYTCRNCARKTLSEGKFNFSANKTDDILERERIHCQVIVPKKKEEETLKNDSLRTALEEVAEEKQEEVKAERKEKKKIAKTKPKNLAKRPKKSSKEKSVAA